MSIYDSGASAAPGGESIYGGGDIYRSGTEGAGVYGSGGGGGLYDLPQQQQPGSSSLSDSPMNKDEPAKPGFGEIDSLSSLDMSDMQMDALDEHHSIQDVNSIIYEVGTTENTMAMVIAYTQSNRLVLLGMKPSQVNANVLWSAAGTANMYPTITHAVLSVPQSGAREKPDFHATMSAYLIRNMRELGADVAFPDSTGVTAREYATRHNVHQIVIDALEMKDTKVRKAQDEGCWCAVQ